MQKFTRRSGANSDLWFRRMDASSRTPPASSPNQAIPSRPRREHLPDSLSMQSQRSHRHKSMFTAYDQSLNDGDLIRGQSRRHHTRTTRLILEIATFFRPTPTVISRCRDARQAQRRGQRHRLLRPVDCTQDHPLRICIRYPFEVESRLRNTSHRGKNSDHCSQERHSALQLPILGEQLQAIILEYVGGLNVDRASVKPASNR